MIEKRAEERGMTCHRQSRRPLPKSFNRSVPTTTTWSIEKLGDVFGGRVGILFPFSFPFTASPLSLSFGDSARSRASSSPRVQEASPGAFDAPPTARAEDLEDSALPLSVVVPLLRSSGIACAPALHPFLRDSPDLPFGGRLLSPGRRP